MEGVRYLKSIFDFFIYPKKFWNEFLSLSPRQKGCQFAIYSALLLVVAFGLSNTEYTRNEVVKFLLRETTTLLPVWVVSTIAIFATKRFRQIKNSAINAFFVVYYTKALFCPCQSIFLYLYANNESYLWLFFAMVFSVAAEIYIIVVSVLIAGLDSSGKRIVWFGIVFSILSFSLIDGANMLWKTGHTDGDENFFNNVNEERKAQLAGLSTEFLIPQAVFICSKDSIILIGPYLYAKPNDDELFRLNESDDVYISKIKSDISLLQSALPHTRFDVNKEYIQKMIRIKEAVIYTFEHRNFSVNHSYNFIYDKDSLSINMQLVAFNDEISAANMDLMKSHCWQICQYDMAMCPIILQFLYRPLLLIPYFEEDKRTLAPRSVNAWKTYFELKNQHTYHLMFK